MDVCRAVQHAHQKGIIHRDIKPTNVMVTLIDGTPVPKVIDFGIAKATEHRLTEKTLYTTYRQLIGTPEYMSPEQAALSGLDVDTRTDTTAIGFIRSRSEAHRAVDALENLQQSLLYEQFLAYAEDLVGQVADYRFYLRDKNRTGLTINQSYIATTKYAYISAHVQGEVGSVYIWLSDQRPEVIGMVSMRKERDVLVTQHRFQSLAFVPLTTEYRGESVWLPEQPGIKLKPIPGAPSPGRTAPIRLSQMCALAEQFTANIGPEDAGSRLTLQLEPMYRYETSGANVTDGALFAFLDIRDPALVLVIEARGEGTDAGWYYALARFSEKRLTIHIVEVVAAPGAVDHLEKATQFCPWKSDFLSLTPLFF